jgi:hypothetical protein
MKKEIWKTEKQRSLYVEIKCQLDTTDDFYCRSYCLLNMFRAPLCPSSGVREYYTDGCCLWYLVVWFSSCRCSVELRVMCPVCGLQQSNTTGSNHLYNTLELLMMGMVVPETCWASNKICNKNHLLHLVGISFPHINHLTPNGHFSGRTAPLTYRCRIFYFFNRYTYWIF